MVHYDLLLIANGSRSRARAYLVSSGCFSGSGMVSWPLRQDKDQPNDHHGQDGRGERAAPLKSSFGYGLVQEVANGCSEGASENEGGPEEEYSTDLRPEVERREN